MPNPEHLAKLKEGLEAWNEWRRVNTEVEPDLSGANLSGADLSGADLSKANLSDADLSRANLSDADLGRANLSHANLSYANLGGADLSGAYLGGATAGGAYLGGATASEADLSRAYLRVADLSKANLSVADLSEANLSGADLSEANLSGANLREAHLREADLSRATLIDTDLTDANLTGCRIFGISAWRLKLEGAKQDDLVITDYREPEITDDNIEVAQFIYLLLNNPKIRDVIDTIGKTTNPWAFHPGAQSSPRCSAGGIAHRSCLTSQSQLAGMSRKQLKRWRASRGL